jgi:hypothetical protein
MCSPIQIGAEGCKQSNSQELCQTSGRIEETTCEDCTGEGKEIMNDYIPDGAFYVWSAVLSFVTLFAWRPRWRNLLEHQFPQSGMPFLPSPYSC